MAEGRGRESMMAHLYLGRLSLDQGDLEAAIRLLTQGLALCRAAADWDLGRVSAAGLGYAYALTGSLAEGDALLEEALRESLHVGALPGQSRFVACLSAVCLMAGRVVEARQHACQALDMARQYGERGNEAFALYQLGVLQAHTNPPDVEQAEAYYLQALTLAEELGMRPLRAHCHLGFGTLYATTGQRQQAHAELSAAIELYRAMDMTFWLPQAEAALAQVT